MSHRFSGIRRLALATALFGAAASAQAVTEIQFWHAMTGANNDRINDFAKNFNESQKDYKVNAVFKGSYAEAMAAAIAAYRAGSAPTIVQVQEVGTATMMSAKGAIKPVHQVMADAGEKFDPKILHSGGGRLLHEHQGPDAVVPVQQLDDGLLLQHGRVREGGPRSQARAGDVARGDGSRGEDQGGGRLDLQLHDGLAVVGAARKLLGVAQHGFRHQGKRLRRQ